MTSHSSWLLRQSHRYPSNIALRAEGIEMPYSELYSQCKNLAQKLFIVGIRKNTHVGLLANNSVESIIFIHALILLRATIIPLNNRFTSDEILKLCKLSDIRYLLIENHKINKNISSEINTVTFKEVLTTFNKRIELNENASYRANDSLALMFTSGSSGMPKLVQLSYENFLYSALNSFIRLKQSKNDSWLLSLPIYHIGGFSIITRSLLYGTTIIVPNSLQSNDLASSIQKFDPTHISLVPTMLQRLLAMNIQPNPTQRIVLLGGGPIDPKLERKSHRIGWKIFPTYGSTETCSQFATMDTVSGIKENCVGKPLPMNMLKIISESGESVETGLTGEILVKGPTVTKGYYKNPQLNKDLFYDGWLRTGDYGFVDKKGYLYMVSRRVDRIISGGENIDPVEVENHLRQHPMINDVCVFPLYDDEWGQIVAAAIVSHRRLNDELLKEYLQGKIASFKIPKKYYFVSELPYSESGKLLRNKVREMIRNSQN